ncbi:hypothetical protein [Helicobacter cetorum]|uniref:Uncharacterized protein n=1 Tax=Helicobacter cetorum (strain ATCC BAA-429 / MIT 00-7128) TaxID=182217 RepID=I0ELK1_HELC0|nr:hypothetical protein [Helicobacter cetorum]AFI03820.1 hypothetical protein HCW_02695 [Helicobacter cetorum MIT 00-7128]
MKLKNAKTFINSCFNLSFVSSTLLKASHYPSTEGFKKDYKNLSNDFRKIALDFNHNVKKNRNSSKIRQPS